MKGLSVLSSDSKNLVSFFPSMFEICIIIKKNESTKISTIFLILIKLPIILFFYFIFIYFYVD